MKNDLLDSLDLNVGMDAIMKLQNKWGNGAKQEKPKPINEVYTREEFKEIEAK